MSAEPRENDVSAGDDFADLLEFGRAGCAPVDDIAESITASRGACPSHPGVDNCLCHGFMVDLPFAENAALLPPVEDPDYSKFENWIPRFVRPEKPCDYCRSKRLNCYLQRGEATCTPCQSLFRDCSLSNSNTLESLNHVDKHTGTFLDTLHPVDEHTSQRNGARTGIMPLLSKSGRSGYATPHIQDDAPGSSKRNGIRFPRQAIKVLRDWLDSHLDHPYPTEAEKLELERQTELTSVQIANWLANARRRRKVTDRARPKLCASPSLHPTTPALPIPGVAEKPWEELNPFERWQHSPPENEPASITDIANAVASSDLPSEQCSTSPSSAGRRKRSSNGSGLSNFRAPSTTSLDTSAAQSSSLSASSAAFSHSSAQSRGSFGSFSSSLAGKRDRRRRRRPALIAASRAQSDDKKRIFQCTFCTDTFKSKYDWTRHEKSLHLSLEKWKCHPLGPEIVDQHGIRRCVYCDAPDPSKDHIESHNHRQCDDKGMDARTFYRKDHLRQHLRLMHSCEVIASMESWKSTAVNINSRCGFCAQRFTVWQERVDHLTAHFKAGARMIDWKGCRGLDPAVAAQVTNAMPPYLIGTESVSPQPFSATNTATWRDWTGDGPLASDFPMEGDLGGRHAEPSGPANCTGFGSKATCWEILTVRLGKYASDKAKQGVILTDEMLQREARLLLYDCDDPWNQTAADNPEWLDLFKKAQGLDYIPTTLGGEGQQVPEDLEAYSDLGLRIPFAVQLQAYNLNHANLPSAAPEQSPGAYQEALTHRTGRFRDLFALLETQGKLRGDDNGCGHEACAGNRADLSWLETSHTEVQYRRWCNQEVGVPLVKPLSFLSSRSAEAAGSARDQSSVSAFDLHANSDQKTALKAKTAYLPRHKLELPSERARLFETITGPWPESGRMPEPIYSQSAVSDANNFTTTGAMMEFLGGDIGSGLPFSTDLTTSNIQAPLVNDMSWMNADGSMVNLDALQLQALDEMIASTTAPLAPSTAAAPDVSGFGALASSTFAEAPPLSEMLQSTPTIDHGGYDQGLDEFMFDDMIFDSTYDSVQGSTDGF